MHLVKVGDCKRCRGDRVHLAEVQLSVLEVVADDCGTLVDNHAIADGDQVKVTHVQRINVAALPNAGSL